MPGRVVCCVACRWEMPSNAIPKHWRARHADPRLALAVPMDVQREMVRLYVEACLPCGPIGERLFWSESMVQRVLGMWGVQMRKAPGRRQYMSGDAILEAAHYYGLGWSQRKIARELGLHRNTVKYRLMRAGVKLGRDPRERKVRTIEQYKAQQRRSRARRRARRGSPPVRKAA